MSYSIVVDKTRCIDCGACTRECARHLPVYKNGQDGSNGLDCVGCLHCYVYSWIYIFFADQVIQFCPAAEHKDGNMHLRSVNRNLVGF